MSAGICIMNRNAIAMAAEVQSPLVTMRQFIIQQISCFRFHGLPLLE